MPAPPPPPPPIGSLKPPSLGVPKNNNSVSNGGENGKNLLLESIRQGKTLKKTAVVNDRSSPLVNNNKNASSNGVHKESNNFGAKSEGVQNGGIKNGGNTGPPMGLGGLFAGGMPKLRPVGSSNVNGGKLNVGIKPSKPAPLNKPNSSPIISPNLQVQKQMSPPEPPPASLKPISPGNSTNNISDLPPPPPPQELKPTKISQNEPSEKNFSAQKPPIATNKPVRPAPPTRSPISSQFKPGELNKTDDKNNETENKTQDLSKILNKTLSPRPNNKFSNELSSMIGRVQTSSPNEKNFKPSPPPKVPKLANIVEKVSPQTANAKSRVSQLRAPNARPPPPPPFKNEIISNSSIIKNENSFDLPPPPPSVDYDDEENFPPPPPHLEEELPPPPPPDYPLSPETNFETNLRGSHSTQQNNGAGSDLESRFGHLFTAINSLTPPEPYLGIEKSYPSKAVLMGKNLAPQPPKRHQYQLGAN